MNSFAVVVSACILVAGFHLIESEVKKFPDFYLNHGGRPLTKSAYQGGNEGWLFDDLTDHDLGTNIIVGVRSISISYGDKIDSIQVTYTRSRLSAWIKETTFRAPRHGIPKSWPTKITLEQPEHVVRVDGQTDGKYVTQLSITTMGSSSGRKVYGPFGKNGSIPFSFEGFIVAFFGGHGLLHLNSIGVYSVATLKKSDSFGGSGGRTFDDTTQIQLPPVHEFVGILEMKIWSGSAVNGIQITYQKLGYDNYLANPHGQLGSGNLTTIGLSDQEILITVEGSTRDNYISHLTFITQKPDGSRTKHGPFGEAGKCSFSFFGNIIALHGTSGSQINGIGIYYV
jgi:hypothetical protein